MPEEKKSGISGIMSKPVPSWVLVLIFLVGIGVGFGAFWVARSNNQAARVVLPVPMDQPADKPPGSVVLPSTSTQPTDVQSTSTASSPEKNPYAEYILQPEKDSAVLSVDWTKPIRRDPSAVFAGVLEANRVAGINDYSTMERLDAAIKQMVSDYNRPVMGDAIGTWERGVVSTGKYKGYKLFEQREGISEMGGGAEFKFLIDPQNKRMLIMAPFNLELMRSYRESGGYEGVKRVYMEWEKVVTPAFGISLDPSYSKLDPQTVGGRRLENREFGFYDSAYIDWLRTQGKMSPKYVTIGTTDQGLQILSDKELESESGCVMIQRKDGGFETFASRLMPWDVEKMDLTVKIDWDEKALAGRKPSETYIATTGACDSFCPILVDKQENLTDGALLLIGKGPSGEPVFAPKQMEQSYSVKQAYESWFLADGKQKPSFAEFLKQKPIPVFFWKDSFGRWVKHNDPELQPPGECGKPVIYLYPEKTTPVSVALPKFIDVTVSEPAYPENGWKVVAHPDGTLDYADGKTYGSLYWEGNGVGYATQKTGFVVKDGEQEIFLTKVLAKYGLNRKEAKEFMDFWLPRMTGAPYYRVSFLTDSWSEAAPLYVSPRPDTNIRIFMDWQKLSAPISLPEPKIMTPARNGFTLVEWGGLLH